MQVEGAFGYLATIEKIMVCIAIHAFLTGTPFDVFSRAGISEETRGALSHEEVNTQGMMY